MDDHFFKIRLGCYSLKAWSILNRAISHCARACEKLPASQISKARIRVDGLLDLADEELDFINYLSGLSYLPYEQVIFNGVKQNVRQWVGIAQDGELFIEVYLLRAIFTKDKVKKYIVSILKNYLKYGNAYDSDQAALKPDVLTLISIFRKKSNNFTLKQKKLRGIQLNPFIQEKMKMKLSELESYKTKMAHRTLLKEHHLVLKQLKEDIMQIMQRYSS